MTKLELTARLAAKLQVTPGEAADQLDDLVHSILARIRKGRGVKLPGLGVLGPGRRAPIELQTERRKAAPRRPRS